jgi:hypothetical protein
MQAKGRWTWTRLARLGAASAWVAVGGLAAVFCMGPSCGTRGDRRGEGEPCTRTRDCEDGLVCIGGECRVPPDAGTADGG